ncbi:MAG: 2Fe-2S iron-sulfur cluster-binding protein [Spongiibacteraceae bacterium]
MAKLTFISAQNEQRVIEVKGGVSVQDAAIQNDVDGINADCGGGCSCGTCHVFVAEEWREKVGLPNSLEASMLEVIAGSNECSRLSCQIKMSDELDGLVVTTPEFQEGC